MSMSTMDSRRPRGCRARKLWGDAAPNRWPLALLGLLLPLAPLGAAAWADDVTPPTIEDRLQKLETENGELRQLIDTLRDQLAAIKGEGPQGGLAVEGEFGGTPDVDALLDVEAAAAQDAGASGQASGDPALNPLMAFTFDFAGNALELQPGLYANTARSSERKLGLRSVELTAQRGVSAYADGFVTFGDHGHGPELEEGYIDINRLVPRANIRLGQWRLDFGSYNRNHEHQLPFVDYPRTLSNFFGHEGLVGKGAEFSYILPTRDFIQLRGGLYENIGGEGDGIYTADPGSRFSVAAQARYNRELGNGTDVNLTVGYVNGPTDDGLEARANAWNIGLQLRKVRGTQLSDRLILDWTKVDRNTGLGSVERDAWSATYFKQCGLYHDWGLMYEDAGFGDPGITGRARSYNAFLTYKAQETQWFRAQLRHSEYPTGPDTDEFILQSIWSIGSHSHEFN